MRSTSLSLGLAWIHRGVSRGDQVPGRELDRVVVDSTLHVFHVARLIVVAIASRHSGGCCHAHAVLLWGKVRWSLQAHISK